MNIANKKYLFFIILILSTVLPIKENKGQNITIPSFPDLDGVMGFFITPPIIWAIGLELIGIRDIEKEEFKEMLGSMTSIIISLQTQNELLEETIASQVEINELLGELSEDWKTYLTYFGDPAVADITNIVDKLDSLNAEEDSKSLVELEDFQSDPDLDILNYTGENNIHNKIDSEFTIDGFTFYRNQEKYYQNNYKLNGVKNYKEVFNKNITTLNELKTETEAIVSRLNTSTNHSEILKLSSALDAINTKRRKHDLDSIISGNHVRMQSIQKRNHFRAEDKSKMEEETTHGSTSVFSIFP